MAEAVVSFVAVRLGYFIQEAKFLYGVGDTVDRAQTELQFMRSFLKDADKRQEHDETLRIWIAKIVDAAYDLEDVVEAYTLKAVLKRRGGIKITLKRFSCILKEGVDLHKIGTEIENITTRISNLRSSLETFNLREIREDGGAASLQLYERQQLLRRSYSHVIEPDIVGLEDSAKEVIMQLMKEDKCLVVSIWGMGGLGKTTLAKHVYHHSEVRHHFVGFAWVCISQRCQVRNVWEAILFKLMSPTTEEREAIAKWRDDEIAQKICLTLQDSRCLVVLDDIWSIEAWESLKAAFPRGGTKSRILLTTRKKAVALCADRNGFLYQPGPLNENESWELLSKIAIAGKDDTNSRSYAKKKELGKKMLHHCGGLPLAITVLAGLLVRKDTENEWDMMLKNAEEYIRRGEGHEEEYAGSLWILKLSYDDLPYYLKLCFLYLAHFPEDSSIPVKRLTQLWMAEGLVPFTQLRPAGSLETMEDVSYSCLNELVERCMVQVGDQGSIRKIKTCHLHDLLRDLCLLKAGEENFLQIVNFSHRNEAMYLFSSSMVTKVASMGKVRRLAVYLEGSADKLVPSRDESNVHIRSLSYFTPVDWTPRNIKLLRPIFKDFKLLRVLKLENMKRVVELSRDIGSLIHLRFLSLFNSDITRLPSSIGNLLCLQTLDLRLYGSTVIPNVIWKMDQLRHLYLPLNYSISDNDELRLAPLRNLQTLQYVSTRYSDLNELADLISLRKLFIDVYECDLRNLEKIFKSTSLKFNRLQSLSVRNLRVQDSRVISMIVSSCRQICKLCLQGLTTELPNDLQYYPNLIKLSLIETDLKEDQITILERLQNLRVLHLSWSAFEKNTKTLKFSAGGFPRLEFLSLSCMDEIEEWTVDEGAMPCLRQLYIEHCGGMKTVPDWLRYITTLRELAITGMSKAFYSRLEKGGADFYKIQHVPSLDFGPAIEEFLSSRTWNVS
ncbi:unnamed protein product [Malus baccata var. baccata]